jgi:site-specific recombinase XerD
MVYVEVVLYKSKKLKNGEHPIMMRFTKDKPKYVGLGKSCPEKLWDFNQNYPIRKHPHYKELKALIDKKKHDANKIVLELEHEDKNITLDQVVKKYKRGGKRITFFDFADKTRGDLISVNRSKYAESLGDTQKALVNYMHSETLSFSDIDHSFLKRFEELFLFKNPSGGGLALHMRNIRKIYNDAIREGYARKEDYPFATYQINKLPKSRRKYALTKKELQDLIKVNAEPKSKLLDAKNFFLFSFYNRGMNLKDIANLKWEDVTSTRFEYTRSKTKAYANIAVSDPVQEILQYYKTFFPNDAGYVFPVYFARHQTVKSRGYRYGKMLGQMNKYLKVLAQEAGIEKNLTFYVARHTWANLMRKMGKSVREISPGLLHKKESTTYAYLEEIENETLDTANAELLDSLEN